MTRFVICPDVALHLAEQAATVPAAHRLLAPTLLRSQVLALLYQQVREGWLERRLAAHRLDHLRRLRVRLLGDRVLQDLAWRLADELGWADTFVAEYVALTRLQADALLTLDAGLARSLRGTVEVASLDALLPAAG